MGEQMILNVTVIYNFSSDIQIDDSFAAHISNALKEGNGQAKLSSCSVKAV
jgi:hypothetical protein